MTSEGEGRARSFRVGFDVGGTFTDFALQAEGGRLEARAQAFDPLRREDLGNERADPRVIRRLPVHEHLGLESIEVRLPRIGRGPTQLFSGEHMQDRPAETPVFEKRGDVLVAGEEGLVPRLVTKYRVRLAQLLQLGIGVGDETRVIEVEVIGSEGVRTNLRVRTRAG